MMHVTTVDMSLALLLAPQLDAVVDAGGEASGSARRTVRGASCEAWACVTSR